MMMMMMIEPSRHSTMSVKLNHLSQHNNPKPEGPRIGLKIILKEVVDILWNEWMQVSQDTVQRRFLVMTLRGSQAQGNSARRNVTLNTSMMDAFVDCSIRSLRTVGSRSKRYYTSFVRKVLRLI
jgi:hypothetical protein